MKELIPFTLVIYTYASRHARVIVLMFYVHLWVGALYFWLFFMSFTSRLLFCVVIILVMGVPMKKGVYSFSFVVSCNLFIIFIYTCIF